MRTPLSPAAKKLERGLSVAVLLAAAVILFMEAMRHFHPAGMPLVLINTTCTVIATALFTSALYFAVHNLAIQTEQRWRLSLFSAVCGLSLLGLFLLNYYPYLFVHRMIEKLSAQAQPIDIVRGMGDYIQKDAGAEPMQEKSIARAAYTISGVSIAYHTDPSTLVYYKPTPDDISKYKAIARTTSSLERLKIISLPMLYGAADVVLTAAVTFLVCLLWAGFRRLPPAASHALCPPRSTS